MRARTVLRSPQRSCAGSCVGSGLISAAAHAAITCVWLVTAVLSRSNTILPAKVENFQSKLYNFPHFRMNLFRCHLSALSFINECLSPPLETIVNIQSDDTAPTHSKTLPKQDLGSLRVRSFTSKLLNIGDQMKTISLEGFQELVLENTKGQCHHFGVQGITLVRIGV
jgi:hypothetical protein